MKVVNKIFAPHSEQQRQIMTFLADPNPLPKMMWVANGTKFGKTIGGCGGMAYAAPKLRNTTCRIVAPIYKQVRVSWKYMSKLWPGAPYVLQNKSDMVMHLPGVNTELQFWHGQSPEDLEGEGVARQINDECAKLRQQVMDSSMTTMTMTRGKMLNISTPRGRNFFYRGFMRAQEEMLRAKREGRTPLEIALTAPTAANPFVPVESIEEARRLLPDRLFRQYYLAEFVDDGSVFPRPKIDLNTWKSPYEISGPVEWWIHPKAKEMRVVAGCDWAKKKDYTVLTVIDSTIRPFKVVGFLRFHHKRYTDQVVDVARFLRRFKECDMLIHDKTGVGEALDDLLSKVPGLVYRGVEFSNASKSFMVNNLITGMENDEILFPWWPTLLHEFDVFEVETNDLGNMRYAGSEGEHDDTVFSSCLAYEAACEYGSKIFEVRYLEDLPQEDIYDYNTYLSDQLDIDFEEGF